MIKEARRRGLRRPAPEIVEGRIIERMLPREAVHQGLLLEADNPPEMALEDMLAAAPETACLVILDQVTDPHNVGAVLRSACAFGVYAVLMTDRHASAATGTLAKAASGAFEHVPLIRLANLSQAMAKLQQAGFWCIGLAQEGPRALHDISLPKKTALIMGAEGEGLRRLTRENCDELAHLPTMPPIGSLNVSNAAAIAIYEFYRQAKKG